MKNYIVYRHVNKINGKVYVGITSTTPEKRWKNGKGYSNMHFGRAIEKYGWCNFEHEIIASGLSRKDACEMERLLIKAHKSANPLYGYNETDGGDGGGMIRKHHTKESKEKISKARKKDGFTETHKKHISESKQGVKHHFAKKVYQYTKDGEFIKEWEYMSLAAKELNISKGNISASCLGIRKTAGGYVWKYERV